MLNHAGADGKIQRSRFIWQGLLGTQAIQKFVLVGTGQAVDNLLFSIAAIQASTVFEEGVRCALRSSPDVQSVSCLLFGKFSVEVLELWESADKHVDIGLVGVNLIRVKSCGWIDHASNCQIGNNKSAVHFFIS